VLLIEIHEKMDEIAFQCFYLIQDHCKDGRIPINQVKDIPKKKLEKTFSIQ
jgi:hypothetical protein